MKPIIHRWTSPGLGSVNTYWIETDHSVVVIDGQRELSKAKAVLCEIEKTGKPIEAVFLTHPHPDHFGGIGVFAAEGAGVPVYGSKTTRESIAEDRFGLVKASHEVVGDDFPAQVALPTHLVSDGDRLAVAGLEIIVREMGPGEAECMTTLYLPSEGAFFCGDLIQNGMTAFLLEGRSAQWIRQLQLLQKLTSDVAMLYPGHGGPGDPRELIASQIAYLEAFRTSIAAERSGPKREDADRDKVASRMQRLYPNYVPVAAIPDLLTKNVEPVAKEMRLSSEDQSPNLLVKSPKVPTYGRV